MPNQRSTLAICVYLLSADLTVYTLGNFKLISV